MKTPLTPDEAARVLDLVAAAGALAPDEREAFLSQAGLEATDLRAEVESLLGFEAKFPAFLAEPAVARGLELLGTSQGEMKPGDILGDCRIMSLLGEGGMGEVYLAVDTKLERDVAVKLLKRGLDEGALMRRFRHERKVLAALTHPNIARLYDGGTTPEHRSYLVMEYVEGERLDEYCDHRKLDVTARLTLFCKVCAAVSYAHQNLVVHRDLKPANIRVTPEGEPKLLDFGIAKLLDPEGVSGVDLTVTKAGEMTPAYASPEQLRSEPVTTATDVYSLGVVLYELLTGERPYRVDNRTPDALAKAICEQPPERPSTAAGRRLSTETETTFGENPTRLRRRLAGDLDTIVSMALRKEPSRRYRSVTQLAEDIRRHLEGLPVIARKDTVTYRTGKFLRRHRLRSVVAGLVMFMLLTGVVAIILYRRDSVEQERAAMLMQKGTTFLQGGEFARAEVPCRQAIAALRGLPTHGPRLAEALTTLSYILLMQGKLDEPEGLLHEAEQIYRDTVGEGNGAYYRALGCEGWLHFLRREYPATETEMRACDAYVRAAGYPRGEQDYVGGFFILGLALTREGKLAEGESILREALELATANQLVGTADPESIAAGLGECLLAEKRYAEAEPLLLRGYRDLKTRPGERVSVSAQAASQLNSLYTAWNKPAEAARYQADEASTNEPTAR